MRYTKKMNEYYSHRYIFMNESSGVHYIFMNVLSIRPGLCNMRQRTQPSGLGQI
jgi:hypothetical protein